MDALIRAPAITTQRLKLGGTASAEVVGEAKRPAPAPLPDTEAGRRDTEERMRAELRAEMQAALKVERETARQRGFAEGQREGRDAAAAAARQQAADREQAIDGALAVVREGFDAAIESLLAGAADVAYAAVVQIAGVKAVTREFVFGQVESVLRHGASDGPLNVRLHPAQAALLKADAQMPSARAVTVVGDAALEIGACVVEGAFGQLDASLSTQLRKLRELLDGCMQGRGP